jgi:hypothetical protein
MGSICVYVADVAIKLCGFGSVYLVNGCYVFCCCYANNTVTVTQILKPKDNTPFTFITVTNKKKKKKTKPPKAHTSNLSYLGG